MTSFFVYKNSVEILDFIDKGQVVKVLNEKDGFYYVRTFEQEGFIKKEYLSDLVGLNIVIDLSSQKLVMYEDKENILLKDQNNDYTGSFNVEEKEENHMINDEEKTDYWMKFNNSYGIYDYNNNDGGYGANFDRHLDTLGNVYMDKVVDEKVYKLPPVGTKVIIQK